MTLYNSAGLILLSFWTITIASRIDNDTTAIVTDTQQISELEEMLISGNRLNLNSPSTKTLTAEDFSGKFLDLKSLLGSISGVTVHSSGGLGAYSSVQIRGSSANQVQIYLDGIPLNTASGGTVDIGKISLGSIQKITIHKSSAPLQLLGSNAGGIIELWSKPHESKDITSASAEIGSFGYRKAGALISHKIERLTHWFSAEYSHCENDFLYDWDRTTYKDSNEIEKRMDNQYFTSASGRYGVEYKSANNRIRISSYLSFNHSENGIFWIPTADINDGFTKNHSLSGLINCHFYLGRNTDLNLELTGKSETHLLQRKEPFFVGNARKRESSLPYAGISAILMHTFTDWLNAKTIIASEFSSYSGKDLWSNLRGTPYSRRICGKLGLEASVDNLQKFSGSIKGVLRYEMDSTNGISLSLINKNQGPAKESEIYPNAEAFLRYNFFEYLSLFASCNYRYRSPGFSEKFSGTDNTQGNERLTPEKRAECDIGILLQTNKLRMSIAGYSNRITDKIIFISAAQGLFVPKNFCEVRGIGLENECELYFTKWLTVSNMLTLMKNILYSDQNPSWNGNYEPYLPIVQDYCSIDVRFRKISFTHYLNFSGGYYTGADNISSGFFRPVPELGLTLSIAPITPLTIIYRLDNYLKTKIYESEGDGKSVEHTQIYYGSPKPGRMHTVSLQLTF